jgi:hypothetical protein
MNPDNTNFTSLKDNRRHSVIESSSIYSDMIESYEQKDNDSFVVEDLGSRSFRVTDKTDVDKSIEIQIAHFGKRCFICFNDIGWFDLLDLYNLKKVLLSSVEGIVIELSDKTHLSLPKCSLKMWGCILEKTNIHVQRILNHHMDGITDVYDAYHSTKYYPAHIRRGQLPNHFVPTYHHQGREVAAMSLYNGRYENVHHLPNHPSLNDNSGKQIFQRDQQQFQRDQQQFQQQQPQGEHRNHVQQYYQQGIQHTQVDQQPATPPVQSIAKKDIWRLKKKSKSNEKP